jgi:hypothetical protein
MWSYNGEIVGTSLPSVIVDGRYNRPARQYLKDDGTWDYDALEALGYTWSEDAVTEPDEATLTAAVRAERNRRLAACDWTQIPDSPLDAVTRGAWGVYREELRNLPCEAGFPWDGPCCPGCPWPTPPSEGMDVYFAVEDDPAA